MTAEQRLRRQAQQARHNLEAYDPRMADTLERIADDLAEERTLTDLQQRRAVAALSDYLIAHAMHGTFTDKLRCVERILAAVNEGQMPDQGAGDVPA